MAKSLAKIHLIDQVRSAGVLPVFHHTRPDVLYQVLRTIYRGGLGVLEFKHHRDSRSIRAFAQLVELASEFPGLTLGAGTVLDEVVAGEYIKAGAQFISSPFLHGRTGELCEKNNVVWMPGCSNTNEVKQAIEQDADMINVVQGSIPVLDFMRSSSRDFPDMYFVPSAGIDIRQAGLPLLFEAGALGVRLGKDLFRKNDILTKDWKEMEIHFYQTVRNVSQLKKSSYACSFS
jgi:2-dehydro-3-deoxyphosphogluconate aldolase / (4S)-4-hydroxy-2-oxoglutarate aldolase